MSMAETNGSLLHSLYAALDPKSLILSQFSGSDVPHLLELTTDCFVMERGPRFKEYSELRDRKLRMKNLMDEDKEAVEKFQNRSLLTPPKKQVKFSSNLATPPRRPRAPSALTQSVPDFSSALRKENRKPMAALPPVAESSLTPPAKSGSAYRKMIGVGSKSANSVEKRSGGLMARKSYASMDELKGLALAAGSAINGENRGGRRIGKTVLGSRQF